MEISGKAHLVGATETVGSKDFKKRQIVVKTDEQYSQHVPIDFVQDKVNLLDNVQVGQEVKVHVNVRGNEYNGKYYVSFQGWKIDCDKTVPLKPTATPPDATGEETDEMPF